MNNEMIMFENVRPMHDDVRSFLYLRAYSSIDRTLTDILLFILEHTSNAKTMNEE